MSFFSWFKSAPPAAPAPAPAPAKRFWTIEERDAMIAKDNARKDKEQSDARWEYNQRLQSSQTEWGGRRRKSRRSIKSRKSKSKKFQRKRF